MTPKDLPFIPFLQLKNDTSLVKYEDAKQFINVTFVLKEIDQSDPINFESTYNLSKNLRECNQTDFDRVAWTDYLDDD